MWTKSSSLCVRRRTAREFPAPIWRVRWIKKQDSSLMSKRIGKSTLKVGQRTNWSRLGDPTRSRNQFKPSWRIGALWLVAHRRMKLECRWREIPPTTASLNSRERISSNWRITMKSKGFRIPPAQIYWSRVRRPPRHKCRHRQFIKTKNLWLVRCTQCSTLSSSRKTPVRRQHPIRPWVMSRWGIK